jgi:hypothetical protein
MNFELKIVMSFQTIPIMLIFLDFFISRKNVL